MRCNHHIIRQMTGRRVGRWLWPLLPLLMVGCDGVKDFDWKHPFGRKERERVLVHTEPVTNRRVNVQSFSMVEQSNGLVTLRHMPAVGGKTIAIRFADDDPLVGHQVRLGPDRLWPPTAQPDNLTAGHYHYSESLLPDRTTVRMVSPTATSGKATVTVEHDITMRQGTTRIELEERLFNRGPDPLDYQLIDSLMLDGRHQPVPEAALRKWVLYLPVEMREGNKDYLLDAADSDAVEVDERQPGDLIAVHYRGQPFQLISRADRQWIVALDSETGWTLVRQFDTREKERFFNEDGPIHLIACADSDTIDLQLRSGFVRRRPNRSITRLETWCLTRCRGPILEVKETAVVCARMVAARDKEYYDISGRYGVFYRGHARLIVLDAEDEALFTSRPIAIEPGKEFKLSAALPADEDAVDIVLKIYDYQDEPVGELDRTRAPM